MNKKSSRRLVRALKWSFVVQAEVVLAHFLTWWMAKGAALINVRTEINATVDALDASGPTQFDLIQKEDQ